MECDGVMYLLMKVGCGVMGKDKVGFYMVMKEGNGSVEKVYIKHGRGSGRGETSVWFHNVKQLCNTMGQDRRNVI